MWVWGERESHWQGVEAELLLLLGELAELEPRDFLGAEAATAAKKKETQENVF